MTITDKEVLDHPVGKRFRALLETPERTCHQGLAAALAFLLGKQGYTAETLAPRTIVSAEQIERFLAGVEEPRVMEFFSLTDVLSVDPGEVADVAKELELLVSRLWSNVKESLAEQVGDFRETLEQEKRLAEEIRKADEAVRNHNAIAEPAKTPVPRAAKIGNGGRRSEVAIVTPRSKRSVAQRKRRAREHRAMKKTANARQTRRQKRSRR